MLGIELKTGLNVNCEEEDLGQDMAEGLFSIESCVMLISFVWSAWKLWMIRKHFGRAVRVFVTNH